MRTHSGEVMRRLILGLVAVCFPSAALAATPPVTTATTVTHGASTLSGTGHLTAPTMHPMPMHAVPMPPYAPSHHITGPGPAATSHAVPMLPPGMPMHAVPMPPYAVPTHAPPSVRNAIHVAPAPTHLPTTHVATPPPATAHVTLAAAAAAKPVKIAAFVPPPAGADEATLVAAGKALIQRQTARTEMMLPTTGFHSLDELGKAIASMGPDRARAVELLKAEKLEFAMRLPTNIRDSVATRGFLNQHDIETSRGAYNPNFRATSESKFIGLSRAEYDRVPNAIRPKFGYLRPTKDSGARGDESKAHYFGEDIVVFKRDAIKDSVTCYPENSLGFAAGGLADAEASAWHHLVFPWSERMLLAPRMRVTDEGNLEVNAPAPTGFKARPGVPFAPPAYLEIQIWRPLGIAQMERFEFRNTPPSGVFLQELRKHGVKIFRQGAAEEWKDDLAPPAAPKSSLHLVPTLAPISMAA